MSFFHIAFGHPRVHQQLMQARQIVKNFLRRRKIRLTHNFDKRHATAIDIHERLPRSHKGFLMDALASIFFHVDAREANSLCTAVIRGHVNTPASSQRHLFIGLKLRNLIPLGQIGIKIILPQKTTARLNRATRGQRNVHRQFNDILIQHGKRARQAQTHRTDMGIGIGAKFGTASAKNFGRGRKLGVYFQTDDRFVSHNADSLSTTAAALKIVSSAKALPSNCKPTGKPSADIPQGTEIPGIPARFTETV